jgi:hypothetical protein
MPKNPPVNPFRTEYLFIIPLFQPEYISSTTMSTDIKFSTANFKAKHSCKVLTQMEVSENVRFQGLSDTQFLFRGSKRPLPKMCRTNAKVKNVFCFVLHKCLVFTK